MKTKQNFTKGLLTFLIVNISYFAFAQIESNNNIPANGSLVVTQDGTPNMNVDLTQKAYDENMVGVYYKDSHPKRIPIISMGITSVKFNSENGKINKGDLITSSSTLGEAMKATKSGMIIGIALEDASSSSGLVKIRVMIQYVKQ